MSFNPASRARLTTHDLGRFAGATLFDRIGRTICSAGCLPRKELYEAWEVAKRSRRFFRGGRVVDVAAGHGLLAQIMLLLDDSSPSAIAVDESPPASAARVHEALTQTWPRLRDRVSFLTGDLRDVPISRDDVVVSCHACGSLTDDVIASAMNARARLAVLPCCHDLDTCETAGLDGWMDSALAIDAARVVRLHQSGYTVRSQTIPSSITPKNRLILAEPS